MNLASPNHFFDTIYRLRSSGEVILYSKMFTVNAADEIVVTELLRAEYETECFNWPYTPPAFEAAAALWAAKTIFLSAQLILHRQSAAHELDGIVPAFSDSVTPAAILSADICLRFLPNVIALITQINPEDALQPILEKHLQAWHYSGIGNALQTEAIQLDVLQTNKCLQQLYIDRVIERKDRRLANLPALNPLVKASLGNFENIFWKELNLK